MMKLLIISALLMLLKAQPLPTTNALSNSAQHLSQALPVNPSLAIKPKLMDPNSLSQKEKSISFSQLVNGFKLDGIHIDLPQEVLLDIFAHRLMTFEEAKKIAQKINANVPESWAIKHHDPSLDKYSILEQWRRMEDGEAKDQLKKKMMLNPTLKNILDWEGGLDLDYENFKNAVINGGSLDIVKYFVSKGMKLSSQNAIVLKNPNPILFEKLNLALGFTLFRYWDWD